MKFVFLAVFLVSAPLMAADIYVAPVRGTNVGKTQAGTMGELLKVEIQSQNNHRLVDTPEQAEFILETKLIKFDTYTLSMTRWRGREKVSTGQWRAKNLAELESTVPVAVKEVLGTQSADGAVLYDNNSSLGEQAEQKKERSSFQRVQAEQQINVGFGPTYFNNMNSSNTAIGVTAGYTWNVDDHFDLGLQSDFAISTETSDAYLLTGKIITNYFFAAQDISPFVGAGFGYGWASVHDRNNNSFPDDSASGFALSLHAGVKMFRTSNVNFAISTEYTTIFDRTSIGAPGAFMIKIALFY